MKKCSVCKIEKSLDEYHKNSRSNDGKTNTCKSCRKMINHEMYLEVRRTIIEAKDCPCSICGESHPQDMMHFHHRDPSEKEFTISRPGTAARSVNRVRAEIAKCDVVCRPCHTKIHNGN